MNPYRKLINLIENAGEAMYLGGSNRTKSVSLRRLPEDVAELLRNNARTVGRFEFQDEGEEVFSYTNNEPMPFIEAARKAADEYSRVNNSEFARLTVARYKIDN